MTILFTVVIPTIGRVSLTRCVESILTTSIPPSAVEVVVVNDSGKPLPSAEWHNSPQVTIIETNRRERSFARNSGAAIARGEYLCFLDDDDWFLPEALTNLSELAQRHPDAAWLYGGIQVVDDSGNCLEEMNSGLNGNCFAQVMGGAWLAIQSSCVRADAFFRSGGYRTDILGTEDLDLCRRIAMNGKIANTPQPIACLLRGNSWDTSTDYLRAVEDTKLSRDDILDEPGSFAQLIKSAQSAYWHGRILRVYLSPIGWNLRRGKIFRALSRALYSIFSIFVSWQHLFAPEYWRGVRAHHVPGTLHFFMEATERARNV